MNIEINSITLIWLRDKDLGNILFIFFLFYMSML